MSLIGKNMTSLCEMKLWGHQLYPGPGSDRPAVAAGQTGQSDRWTNTPWSWCLLPSFPCCPIPPPAPSFLHILLLLLLPFLLLLLSLFLLIFLLPLPYCNKGNGTGGTVCNVSYWQARTLGCTDNGFGSALCPRMLACCHSPVLVTDPNMSVRGENTV